MKIIIPCGGYGTRMRDLGIAGPKALLDIAGLPLLTRIIYTLKDLNPEEFIIISNGLFYEQFIRWKETVKDIDIPIDIINDGTYSNDARLGTLKDVQLTFDRIGNKPFLVYLGDNLIRGSLRDAYDLFLEANMNVVLLHDVGSIDIARRFGIVELGESQRIIGFEEKPSHPKSTLISTGIYFLLPDIKKKINIYIDQGHSPEGFGFLMQHTLKEITYKGMILDGSVEWIDIGTLESYNYAQKLYSDAGFRKLYK